MGRFIQQDPAGEGVNWYAYVDDNPVTGIDPEGLAYLVYAGGYEGTLGLYHDTGDLWMAFPGKSGLPGSYDPITPGRYRVCPDNITRTADVTGPYGDLRFMFRLRFTRRADSWGPERVPLDPTPETNRRIHQRRDQHLVLLR